MNNNRELFEHYRFLVDSGQQALRIDKYLNIKLPNTSRTKIKTAADNQSILVNNIPVKANYKVKPGDIIKIVLTYPPREIKVIPEDIPLNIVYEDKNLLVVNKKAGMVVHPSYGHYQGTLVNALAHHLKNLPLFKTNDPRPGLIHRIDKDTSGLLVVAKTEDTKSYLSKQFLEKTTTRKYIALVWGIIDCEQGTIRGHVGRNLKNRKIMDVFPNGEHGKHAITHYKVIERIGYVTLVECCLETGRTHQIRAHFKYIKHPLFNDADYGGNQILKGVTFTKYKQFVINCFKICPRQALHAKSLGFTHPKTHKLVSFHSPLPKDMKMLIEKWRKYIANREILDV